MRVPSAHELQRMPPGDRAPRLRCLAERERIALAALVDEPPGKLTTGRRTRRTRNLAKLSHIARAVGVEM